MLSAKNFASKCYLKKQIQSHSEKDALQAVFQSTTTTLQAHQEATLQLPYPALPHAHKYKPRQLKSTLTLQGKNFSLSREFEVPSRTNDTSATQKSAPAAASFENQKR
jgi:hypothetical protein